MLNIKLDFCLGSFFFTNTLKNIRRINYQREKKRGRQLA